ncbi:MAG: GGDEF domain-containing protein [Thermoanaerobaculia bacterium]
MNILLWQWSTAVQLTSAFMIAVFFIVLSRSVRRPEMVLWRRAWIANLLALIATLVFWYLQPSGVITLPLVRAAYLAAKLAFVVFIAEGAWIARHAGRKMLHSRQRWIGIALYAVFGGIAFQSIMTLGFVQHGLMAAIFIAAAVGSARAKERRAVWLASGLFLRAVVALAEAAAYAIVRVESVPASLLRNAALFVAASSSFDSGAEWLLALGCVLVISDRIQQELEQSNRELLATQDDLRAMADRDALTATWNRRALPSLLRKVQPQGATILFFDLDAFKVINDLHGHEVGDRCLKSFAATLQACFRPDDAIVRYGGDEFLVIAGGLDAAMADQRVALVRQRLYDDVAIPRMEFSVGRGDLPPGGRPEDALRAADAAMYASKLAEPRRA